MAFHFRLASVLRHRKHLEDAAALDLARANLRLEALSRQLTRICDEMAARTRDIGASAARGASGMELRRKADDVQTLDRWSVLTAAEAAAQREQRERARQSLVEASRSREAIERLEASQRAAHAREVEAMERRRADEVTAASYLWRRAQTAGGPEGAR
ncbi:MAG TPA: flagellar export protein FliJ [Terriglobales bacterium]|nr:flagellar export protein FliJ [Terriglobales bacterium]